MLTRRAIAVAALLSAVAHPVRAQGSSSPTANWPVYGGSDDHSHYTTLGQITPGNVKQLKVAWTYDTRDAFAGSEMQTNPVVVDGVTRGHLIVEGRRGQAVSLDQRRTIVAMADQLAIRLRDHPAELSA